MIPGAVARVTYQGVELLGLVRRAIALSMFYSNLRVRLYT
jgi:hypothetical protein